MDREKRNAIREQSMKGESSDWVLHLPLSSEDERREVDGASLRRPGRLIDLGRVP